MTKKQAIQYLKSIDASTIGQGRIDKVFEALCSTRLGLNFPNYNTQLSREDWARVLVYCFMCPAGRRALIIEWGLKNEPFWRSQGLNENNPVFMMELVLSNAKEVVVLGFDPAVGIAGATVTDKGKTTNIDFPKKIAEQQDWKKLEEMIRTKIFVPGSIIQHIAKDIEVQKEAAKKIKVYA